MTHVEETPEMRAYGLPGRSFQYMEKLVEEANAGSGLTDELALAIFWERSLFTNAAGTDGAGFARIEPGEFWALEQFGVRAEPASMRSDTAAARVSCLYLKHLLKRAGGVTAALRVYTGYGLRNHRNASEKEVAAWRSRRQAVIDGYLACERILRSSRRPRGEAEVKRALHAARPFPLDPSADPDAREFHNALFPAQPVQTMPRAA